MKHAFLGFLCLLLCFTLLACAPAWSGPIVCSGCVDPNTYYEQEDDMLAALSESYPDWEVLYKPSALPQGAVLKSIGVSPDAVRFQFYLNEPSGSPEAAHTPQNDLQVETFVAPNPSVFPPASPLFISAFGKERPRFRNDSQFSFHWLRSAGHFSIGGDYTPVEGLDGYFYYAEKDQWGNPIGYTIYWQQEGEFFLVQMPARFYSPQNIKTLCHAQSIAV